MASFTESHLLVKEQLAAKIREQIMQGRLHPGQRVVEAAWAREFGVAQASVREAINLLVVNGFLVKTAGRSARVPQYTQQDLTRIYQVRGALEGLAAQLATAGQADLTPLDSALARMEAALAQGDVKQLLEADLEFHLALGGASGNPVLTQMLGRLLRPLFTFVLVRMIERHQDLGSWTFDLPRHREMIDMIRENNPALAGQFVQHHVGRFVATAQAVWWPDPKPRRKRGNPWRSSELRVALIAGRMYDRLYARIPGFEGATGVRVTVGFRGTHPELNAHLAAASPDQYDVVSTHTKYAPSQQHILAPVEGFETTDFFPAVLDLATVGGALYGIPRNIDLRLLHYRTDLIDTPPATWDELVELAVRIASAPGVYGYVFPGMESGLFGTFFELAEVGGARIFPDSLVAEVRNKGGRWALGIIRELYEKGATPPEICEWHYDQVHRCFREGHAAMVADWPGFYGSYRAADSPVRTRFRVARMPAGPSGCLCSFAGSHTFALTRRGAVREEARELLQFLTAPGQQAIEAKQGSVPVRRSLMDQERKLAKGNDAERLRLLAEAIESELVTAPKTAFYPAIESLVWRTVQKAMRGEVAVEDALAEIEMRSAEYVAHAA
jgi:multiple sugar transport system substrate-binding protein